MTLKKTDVSVLHRWDCDSVSTFKCRGDFGGEPRGSPLKSVFSIRARVAMSSLRLETATLRFSSHFLCVSSGVFLVLTGMAAITSTIAINAEQLSNSPQLEPAFEHLLRNSKNAITDRDTFVHMFDSEAALKDGASDLGFDLTAGGLPHKREFARVVTSWKTAKIMAETKLQTDAVAKAHGLRVTFLPCDWTCILTKFEEKVRNTNS